MQKHNGKMVVAEIWPFLWDKFKKGSPSAWPPDRNEPHGPLLVYFLWEGEENDKVWIDQMTKALEHIRRVALSEKCTTESAAVYYNTTLADVTSVQDIYRDNLRKLRLLRKQYDPSDVMANAGGFRIPIVRPLTKFLCCAWLTRSAGRLRC
jgi:hypothetical protein